MQVKMEWEAHEKLHFLIWQGCRFYGCSMCQERDQEHKNTHILRISPGLMYCHIVLVQWDQCSRNGK